MSNLIDRDELIEAIKQHKYCSECDLKYECYDSEFQGGIGTCELSAIKYIDLQPTVNEWIPVEREVPKDEKQYWVTNGNMYGVGVYMKKFGGWATNGMNNALVVAWMPIPTYKENE